MLKVAILDDYQNIAKDFIMPEVAEKEETKTDEQS